MVLCTTLFTVGTVCIVTTITGSYPGETSLLSHGYGYHRVLNRHTEQGPWKPWKPMLLRTTRVTL